jgi:hypothetical protein
MESRNLAFLIFLSRKSQGMYNSTLMYCRVDLWEMWFVECIATYDLAWSWKTSLAAFPLSSFFIAAPPGETPTLRQRQCSVAHTAIIS